MIREKLRRFLSGIIIAVYLMVYIVPAGMCISSAPQASLRGSQPTLRTVSQPSSLKLQGDISITKGNPKISLSLRDSDVRQVLRMFADKAGLNIIFHDSATGKVTLDLVNVPLNDAFRMVLQIADLTYYVDNNTMVVVSATASQGLTLTGQEMSTIPVKYVDAAIIADFLNKNIFSTNKPGLSNALVAVTNPNTNEILIFGTKNDYLMAKKIVSQFDVQPREKTFTVNHTTPKEMAELVCNLLFREVKSTTDISTSWTGHSGESGATSSGSASSSSSDEDDDEEDEEGSSSSSESSSSSSTGTSGSSGSSGASSLSLGGGVIACKYRSRVTAGNLYSLKTDGLSVTYFPQRGTIQMLGGSQQQFDLVSDFIAKNDKKQPQAYLELSIVELSEKGAKSFNNTWNVYSKFFSGTFDGTTATNPSYPNIFGDRSYTVDRGTSITDTIFPKIMNSTPSITYSMNYSIENIKGRILANPRIMITNGQESIIDLSADYVKTVKTEVMSGSGALAGAVQRTYEIASDDGIKISLVPFISPQGYVTLNIKPTYATIKGQVTVPTVVNGKTYDDLQATLLQRRNLDLKNIRIKDGETLAIGGMIKENETKNVKKIPVLGDLPGVGMFFRNTSTDKTKSELVIMITPKIIRDSEDVVSKPNVML